MRNRIKRQIQNIHFIIENALYHIDMFKISMMGKIRYMYGWCASKFICTNKESGFIHIPMWKIKLFKCVTADDVYIITGIWHALINSKICEGYENFGITNETYIKINDILIKNYKWNSQTWYDNHPDSKITFTWANYSPISIQGIPDNHIVWTVYDVRQLCTKQENGGWKFGT